MKHRHTGIVTHDMDEEIAYYVKKLGAHVITDHVEDVRIVKLDIGIELLQYESMSEATLRKEGISHIAFTQDSEGNNLEFVHHLPYTGGRRIKELREQLGISQAELARRVNVAQSNISAVEHGQRITWPKLRKQLTQILNCNEKELLLEE